MIGHLDNYLVLFTGLTKCNHILLAPKRHFSGLFCFANLLSPSTVSIFFYRIRFKLLGFTFSCLWYMLSLYYFSFTAEMLTCCIWPLILVSAEISSVDFPQSEGVLFLAAAQV